MKTQYIYFLSSLLTVLICIPQADAQTGAPPTCPGQFSSIPAASVVLPFPVTQGVDLTVTGPSHCGTGVVFFDDGHFAYGLNHKHAYNSAGLYEPIAYALEGYSTSEPARIAMLDITKVNSLGAVTLSQAVDFNIAFGSGTPIQSLRFPSNKSVFVTQSWGAARTRDIVYIVAFKHSGGSANAESGTIQLHMPCQMNFKNIMGPNNSTITVHNSWATLISNTNNSVEWNFSNLQPNETRYLYVLAEFSGSCTGKIITSVEKSGNFAFSEYNYSLEEVKNP